MPAQGRRGPQHDRISPQRRGERLPQERAKETRSALARTPAPDWRKGFCATAFGIRVMDAFIDAPLRGHGIANARDLCLSCPILAECGRWIQAVEHPAGSWSGMYGALTPSQRRDGAARAG